ncbi:MAG TPA: hypothetical protein VL359_08785 [bacterium]|nr:hypothetical protein [bacterium]
MKIHPRTVDVRGSGRWDINTTRYIPHSGGSRSRLPIVDDADYARYPGYVGMDERLTEDLSTMIKLYGHLGGKVVVPEGAGNTFVSLILEETLAKLRREEEETKAKDRGSAD